MNSKVETQPGDGILEEFRIDFLDCWRRLPNKGFFFLLLAALLLLFEFLGNSTFGYAPTRSLLRWMYLQYNPGKESTFSDDGHGNMIPFVVLGLFWWKRKELLALPLRTWAPGLVLVVLGLFLHFTGYVAQQPRVSIIGMFTGIYGLMGLAWGPSFLKHSFFPFFLFAFCVPLGQLAEAVTFPLRLMVCRVVEGLSHWVFAIPVLRSGTLLKDPTGSYSYEVAVACSGMRSLIVTIGLAVITGWLSFPQWWKRGLMVVAAFPLAVLANIIRLQAIIIAAEMGGASAGDYVHKGGPGGFIAMLPYILALGGVLLMGRWLRQRDPSPAQPQALA